MPRKREMFAEFQWRRCYRETLHDLEEELEERTRKRRQRYSNLTLASTLLASPQNSALAKCSSVVSRRRPVARFEWRHRTQQESRRRPFEPNEVQKQESVDVLEDFGEEQSRGEAKVNPNAGVTEAARDDGLGEAKATLELGSAPQLPIPPHTDDGGLRRFCDAEHQQGSSNISSSSLVEVEIVSGTLEEALNEAEQNADAKEDHDSETSQRTQSTVSTQDAHKSLSLESHFTLQETWQMMHALQQKIEQVKAAID